MLGTAIITGITTGSRVTTRTIKADKTLGNILRAVTGNMCIGDKRARALRIEAAAAST